MPNSYYAFKPERLYGLTRGVQAYHDLVAEKSAFKDRTVEDIAKAALLLAVTVDGRNDIVVAVAAKSTIEAIDAETMGIQIGGFEDL